MLSRNLRIVSALVFSMAVHGMLIATEFGPHLAPVTGVARKKVSVRLIARRPAAKRTAKKVVVEQPEKIVRALPVLPETVEVAVKEIPSFASPIRPMVPDLLEDLPVPDSEAGRETLEDSAESQAAAVVLARPLYLDNPSPEYPALARRRQWQGTVMLAVMVSRDGAVMQLRVSESSGWEVLDEAALHAVAGWRFEPGRRGGNKVDMQVLVPVRFILK